MEQEIRTLHKAGIAGVAAWDQSTFNKSWIGLNGLAAAGYWHTVKKMWIISDLHGWDPISLWTASSLKAVDCQSLP